MNVLQSTWAFKLKCFPDGLVKKVKAPFYAREGQQDEGIDFFKIYPLFVQWTTICLMLILEVISELKSNQADITAIFLHASLEEGEILLVETSLGFRKKGKVLKLKKTLYGLCQAPCTFWKYLVEKLEACRVSKSKLDPC